MKRKEGKFGKYSSLKTKFVVDETDTNVSVVSSLGGEVDGYDVCPPIPCQNPVPRDVALRARHLADWCIPAVQTHKRPIEHAATMPTGSLPMHFQYNKPLPSWC